MNTRNSLTDYEVSIVKALLLDGEHTNQQIAGLINRYRGGAEKDISSGRISNIKRDQIQKYVPIKPASPELLKEFLTELDKKILSNLEGSEKSFDENTIFTLLPVNKENLSRLDITETDQLECKEGFNFVLKTAAGFANNKGGYFVFGVKNKTWDLVGLNEHKLKKFEELDLKDINQKIRSHLGIDLQIQKKKIKISGKNLGLIYVPMAHTKPVIFIKSKGEESIAEGHIYYRYPGEDRLITPSDLQRIIEDRIRQLSETVLTRHISKILSIGPTKAAVMNTETGQVDGPAGSFVIDKQLLKKLKFIKEGEFQEKVGAPTLKLVGDLVTSDKHKITIQLENITNDDLITKFLEQEAVPNPLSFVKRLVYTQTKWLPIYYYLSLANVSLAEAIGLLKVEKGSQNSINNQTERIKNNKIFKAVSQNASKHTLLENIKTKKSYKLSKMSLPEKRKLLNSIQLLKKNEIDKNYILNLLKDFYQNEFPQGNYAYQSLIRGAISYLDMILFRFE